MKDYKFFISLSESSPYFNGLFSVIKQIILTKSENNEISRGQLFIKYWSIGDFPERTPLNWESFQFFEDFSLLN